MPKTRQELTLYCRQWQKNSYDEKRFNKSLREYIETKYIDLFKEFTCFYKELDEANPGAKDITKTKQFKSWKKEHKTAPVRNDQNVQNPQSSDGENIQIPQEVNHQNEQNINVQIPQEVNHQNEQIINGQIPQEVNHQNEQNLNDD